ncbi:MAG: YkgJ family cysteine cluster protein [Caldilineae bacterium]|nr:MAG: YkgJ family cysteine cluster protein [Caldilineae bacterium]
MNTPSLMLDPDRVTELGHQHESRHAACVRRLTPLLRAGERASLELLARTAREMVEAIDCTECGRCCRYVAPEVEGDDQARLAIALNLSIAELRRRFLRPMWPGAAEEDQVWLLPDPCPFHDGRLCTVYEARPQTCRDFPHLLRNDPVEQLQLYQDTAPLCLISYNIMERLCTQLSGSR